LSIKNITMAEEEQIFDASLKKKKKTKKTPFDLEAVLSADSTVTQSQPSDQTESKEKENLVPNEEAEESSLQDLDLESFGKKKKKKKGAALEELDKKETQKEGGGTEEGGMEDTDLEFSGAKKKKSKKKRDIDELVKETGEEGDGLIIGDETQDGDEDLGTSGGGQKITWLGSDRDYTYDELLTRVFDIMRLKNPEMASGTKQKFVMRPPQVVRVGTKKTSFVNFMEICKMLHRHQKHLLDFLLSELGTSGSIDGNNQLIIKGRFQQKQIENVLRRYIKEYVTCHTCRSPNTLLQKDSRIFFLQCEACGSRCSVASIKHGFQAVTGKRAAIRAKAV